MYFSHVKNNICLHLSSGDSKRVIFMGHENKECGVISETSNTFCYILLTSSKFNLTFFFLRKKGLPVTFEHIKVLPKIISIN